MYSTWTLWSSNLAIVLCLNTLINSVYAVRTPFCCQSLTYLVLFHGPFPYLGSEHQVSILQVLHLVLLPSVLLSPSCLFVQHHSTSVLVFLPFSVHSLPSSTFSLLHIPQFFSPHILTISVLLLWFSYLHSPHLPLLLFLLSWSSQCSLVPSAISTSSSLLFLLNPVQPSSVPGFQCPTHQNLCVTVINIA